MPTPFQQRVYDALLLIPKGRVTTYGAIANFLGTKAFRAVGSAVGKNPNAPAVPCHRVVPQDGCIGNYSAGEGVSTKIALLYSENVFVKAGKIVDFEAMMFQFKGITDA